MEDWSDLPQNFLTGNFDTCEILQNKELTFKMYKIQQNTLFNGQLVWEYCWYDSEYVLIVNLDALYLLAKREYVDDFAEEQEAFYQEMMAQPFTNEIELNRKQYKKLLKLRKKADKTYEANSFSYVLK
jgi:hypothetical protein